MAYIQLNIYLCTWSNTYFGQAPDMDWLNIHILFTNEFSNILKISSCKFPEGGSFWVPDAVSSGTGVGRVPDDPAPVSDGCRTIWHRCQMGAGWSSTGVGSSGTGDGRELVLDGHFCS